MLRRTTIVMVLAFGALAAALIGTGTGGMDHMLLAASERQATATKLSHGAPLQTARVIPAKPSQAAPPLTGHAVPVDPCQLRHVAFREITANQASVLVSKYKTLPTVAPTQSTPLGSCEVSVGGFLSKPPGDFRLEGTAYYRAVPGSPGFYEWFVFKYRVLSGSDSGSHSNVTVRMFESGTPKFSDVSLDDRRYAIYYYIQPTAPIYTRTTSSSWVDFEATFDRSAAPDPHCTARTGR